MAAPVAVGTEPLISTTNGPRCQCDPNCKEVPSPKTGRCKKHSKFCPSISPLSGWEPPFNPEKWNTKQEIRETHNCFAYAMNIHDPKQKEACRLIKNCNVPFHQPGSASAYPKFGSNKLKTCSDMVQRILGDNPTIKRVSFEKKCPAHTSKIAIVVDPDEDYHFYRQDSNGYWSHKPGGTPVTNLDADKSVIYNPALANRNYTSKNSNLNYDIFCSFLCVPRDAPLHLKVGGTRKEKGKRKTMRRRRRLATRRKRMIR